MADAPTVAAPPKPAEAPRPAPAPSSSSNAGGGAKIVTIQKGMWAPPWLYIIGGAICTFMWLGATSIQIYTSEQWLLGISGGDALLPHFSALGQLLAFWNGGLNQDQVASYTFAWCVQAALLACSIGLELPSHTESQRRRAKVCGTMCLVLIIINSLGDFTYNSHLSIWAHFGFTAAVFFGTFFLGIAAAWLFMHGIKQLH